MNWGFSLVLLSGWINRDQTAAIEYLQEENCILRRQLEGKRRKLTDIQRQRLALRAYELGKQQLKELETIVTPATLMRWYRQLLAKKFDGSQQRQQGPGHPRVDVDIEALVLRIAQEKPGYGYLRIQGVLANLGHDINASTVRTILRRNTIEPAPDRNNSMSWNEFLKIHWGVLTATDFFTAEVATLRGMVTFYVLFVIDSATRRVEIAGVTVNPNEAFMLQCTRQLTDPLEGFLNGKRYLIHDRETLSLPSLIVFCAMPASCRFDDLHRVRI